MPPDLAFLCCARVVATLKGWGRGKICHPLPPIRNLSIRTFPFCQVWMNSVYHTGVCMCMPDMKRLVLMVHVFDYGEAAICSIKTYIFIHTFTVEPLNYGHRGTTLNCPQ